MVVVGAALVVVGATVDGSDSVEDTSESSFEGELEPAGVAIVYVSFITTRDRRQMDGGEDAKQSKKGTIYQLWTTFLLW